MVVAAMTLGMARAEAQIAVGDGSNGGMFGGRTAGGARKPAQELTVQLDIASGQDNNELPPDATDIPSVILGAQPSTAITTAAVDVFYRLGTARTFLNGRGRAFTSHSTGVEQIRNQAWTRDVTIGGELALGARSGLVPSFGGRMNRSSCLARSMRYRASWRGLHPTSRLSQV